MINPRHPLLCCLLLGLAAALLPGCAAKPAVDTSADAAAPRMVAAADYDAALSAAVQVLRDRGFTVDRRDRRFGVVTTEPLGAATLGEFWKPNHATADVAVRSTLNDQRRTVTVTLTPAWDQDHAAEAQAEDDAPAPPYLLSVEVLVERRQTVTRRVGGAPANQVFTYLDATPVELRRRGITDDYWRPLGRDPDLEARIADQITDRPAS